MKSTLKRLSLFADVVVVELVQHDLHRLGDRVIGGEMVVTKERVKDRFGDQVLRQHFDGISFAYFGVQIIADFIKEGYESSPF